MALALGSVLLWLLNLASAALIAGRGRAGRLVALRRADPVDLARLADAAAGLPAADAHLRAGVRARVADSAEPGPACRPARLAAGRPRKRLAPPAARRCSPWPGRPAPGCAAAVLPRSGIPFAGRVMDPSPAGAEPALHPDQAPGRRAAVTAGEQITRHCAG